MKRQFARLADAERKSFGLKRGLPRLGGSGDSKYLLSGFVRCGLCGGGIVQSWQAHKSVYRCWYNWSRGPAVCTNTLTVPQERAEVTVLRGIERDVLDAQVVEAAIAFSFEQLTHADRASAVRREALRTELERLDDELARYADAIGNAGPLDTILQAIKVPEERRDAIRGELKVFALQRSGLDPVSWTPQIARKCGRSGVMAKRKRRAFTKEFKVQAVRIVRESGKAVGTVARELDLTETALRSWVRQAEIDAGRGRRAHLRPKLRTSR
jgi:Transposase/Recombinase zinc beta ribbon domain